MFIITILLAILGLIATDIFAPSLPNIAIVFHQTLNHTELTMTLFLVSFAVSQLFYGPISDRTGRKAPLIVGILFFNVAIGVAGALYGFCQIFTSMIVNCILTAIPEQGQMVLGIFYLTLGIGGLGLLKIGSKTINPSYPEINKPKSIIAEK